MRAGRLDQRVTIERPTFTRNARNEPVEGEPGRTETFAAVTPAGGSERFVSAEIAANAPVRFLMRLVEGRVKVTDRIVWRGRTHGVDAVNEFPSLGTVEVLATARGE